MCRVTVDSDFNDDWIGEVESKVEACDRMSGSCEDAILDKEMEKAEIAKCINKTGALVLKYGCSGMVSQLFSVV